MILTARQEQLLMEAARRWIIIDDTHRAKGIRWAWTGLGSATYYKPVVDAGLMEIATRPNPGHLTWWRLTDKGAAIVRPLLDAVLKPRTILFTADNVKTLERWVKLCG